MLKNEMLCFASGVVDDSVGGELLSLYYKLGKLLVLKNEMLVVSLTIVLGVVCRPCLIP